MGAYKTENSEYKEFEQIIAKMYIHGITKVWADFDGSGDCGQISEVGAEPKWDPDLDIRLRYMKSSHNWNPLEKKYDSTEREVIEKKSLENAFEFLVYRHLDEHACGYEINEGGYGRFEILLKDELTKNPVINFNHYQYVMESELVTDTSIEFTRGSP